MTRDSATKAIIGLMLLLLAGCTDYQDRYSKENTAGGMVCLNSCSRGVEKMKLSYGTVDCECRK